MTDTISRGDHAKRLLNDDLLQEALDIIEENITELWKGSDDSKSRNELWYTLKGLERFEAYLQIVLERGEFDKLEKE